VLQTKYSLCSIFEDLHDYANFCTASNSSMYSKIVELFAIINK
jgi:hypothetical protein